MVFTILTLITVAMVGINVVSILNEFRIGSLIAIIFCSMVTGWIAALGVTSYPKK